MLFDVSFGKALLTNYVCRIGTLTARSLVSESLIWAKRHSSSKLNRFLCTIFLSLGRPEAIFSIEWPYKISQLTGNCSFYEPATTETRPSRGIEVAKWSNNRALGSRLWRYKGRCMVPCTGTYKPGTLRVNVDVDKGTTNFNVSFATFNVYGHTLFQSVKFAFFVLNKFGSFMNVLLH